MANSKSIDKLKIDTIDSMALFDSPYDHANVGQRIDQVIIDCVHIRANFAALDNCLNKKQKNSTFYTACLVGTLYSVGLKVRKLLDNNQKQNSLNRLWRKWYEHKDGKIILIQNSSESEVRYIQDSLIKPKTSKYKKTLGYLNEVLAHNRETNTGNIMWADIDELLCFCVRIWSLLVVSTDQNYSFGGPFLNWDQMNNNVGLTFSSDQRQKMEYAWNTYCRNASHWRMTPITDYY